MLKLIGSARERYDTGRAALRYRGEGRTRKEIRERIASTQAGRRAFGITPREASERALRTIDHPESDGSFGWRCRAWYAGKGRWRLGTERPKGGFGGSSILLPSEEY